MVDFFLSPESQRGIERERLNRQRRMAQARSRVAANPGIGQRLVAADQLNPQASNELKQAYALTRMPDEDYLELSEREAERVDSDGGVLDAVGDALNSVGMGIWNQLVKPAVRGAFTIADGLAQEVVQRPFVALNEAATAGGLPVGERFTGLPGRVREAYNEYGDSALVNVAQGDYERGTEGGVLGRGLFAGGAAQAESERERSLTIRGESATFGRSVANGLVGEFYAPGDRVYDITAGVAQFTGDVALDPAALATMGATKALAASKGLTGVRTFGQARRGISIEHANAAKEALDAYGLISTPRRNTALYEQVSRVFGNTRVLDDLASRDSYEIMQAMKLDRLGARGDDLAELVTRLGDEADPVAIGDILIDAAQRGLVRERGFYAGSGSFIANPKQAFRDIRLDKNLPEFRYGGVNPSRVVSAANRMQAAVDVDALLRVAKVGETDRAGLVNRALRVTGNDDLIGVVHDSVRAIGRRMEDVGVAPERIDELIEAHSTAMNRTTSYLLDEAGRPSPGPWKQTKKVKIRGIDEAVDVPSASMIAHLNKQVVPLPDAQDIRRATVKLDGLRQVYESAGWDMATSAANFTSKYLFKFPTLFTRLAYPLRNFLDNTARASAAGHSTLFTNPRAWFHMGVFDPEKFRDVVTDPNVTLAAGRGWRRKPPVGSRGNCAPTTCPTRATASMCPGRTSTLSARKTPKGSRHGLCAGRPSPSDSAASRRTTHGNPPRRFHPPRAGTSRRPDARTGAARPQRPGQLARGVG